MRYIVIEIQTASDGTVGNLVTAHATRSEAEGKYHAVLSAAAVSALPQHAAALLASDGTLIDSRCYEHAAEGE